MNHTLTVSDAVYQRLEAEARWRGLHSVEALLESWAQDEHAHHDMRATVQRIDERRERLASTGQMPDSIKSLREDRSR